EDVRIRTPGLPRMVFFRGQHMRRLPRTALWAVGIGGLLAGLAARPLAAQAPQPPSGELRIASLISRLGSSSFADRRAANDELATMGLETRQQLEAAARDADP